MARTRRSGRCWNSVGWSRPRLPLPDSQTGNLFWNFPRQTAFWTNSVPGGAGGFSTCKGPGPGKVGVRFPRVQLGVLAGALLATPVCAQQMAANTDLQAL